MLETKHAVRRILALNEPQQSVRPDLRAGVAIRALPGEARFSLRLDPEAARQAGEIAGFRLDIPLNSRAGTSERSVARLGPNEWLLMAADSEAEVIPGQVEAALSEHFHVLVDVSHRNVGLHVIGRHAPEVLNSGCPLDLSTAAFPAGSATRTILGKAEIVLIRLDDAPSYRVECWRSFASYVHEYLLDAAREFEPAVR